MSEILYKVTIGDQTKDFPEGMPYGEVLQGWDDKVAADTVLVLVNGILCELHKKLRGDCVIEAVSVSSPIGREVYKRSLNFLFLKAFHDVAGQPGDVRVMLQYANGNGYYYETEGVSEDKESLVRKVHARMREIVEQKIRIKKDKMKTSAAKKIFAEHGMEEKSRLFRFRRVSQVNVYSLENYMDYFYGYMVWHTGYLQNFDLTAYEKGIVLVLPDASDGKTVRPFTPFPKIFQVQCLSEEWALRQGIENVADLNAAITEERMSQQMLVTEALQEGRIAQLASEICNRGNVKFVMIAGPSSSGKTTFSRRLSIQLIAQGMKPHPLSLDDFYRDRDFCPRDENGDYDYECLEALDVDLILKSLREMQEGRRVELPRFNFLTGKPEYKGDSIQLGDEDIMVIEGIHGLNPELSRSLPEESIFRIYISALTTLNIDDHNYIPTTDARLLRRIVRDYYHRGTSACETIERWPSVRKGEQKYIFTNQENADAMFNSHLLYELSILKVYAEPLLFQVPEDRPEFLEAKRMLKFLDYFLGFPSDAVPMNSILREFIGGSCFDV